MTNVVSLFLTFCSFRRFNHELNSRLIKVNVENGWIQFKVCYANKNIKAKHKEMEKEMEIFRSIRETLIQINLYEAKAQMLMH